MPIKILSEIVANQIAAGEVVEGPSSVIKELVENSIDAGANKIQVELSNNLRDIFICDNGSGMSPEDLDLAFKRHATSKLKDITDLDSLLTNGFRGEALASISAVAKITCISKRAQDEHASKLFLAGTYEEKNITAGNNGTSIFVEELFYNTPARSKFLKSQKKEKEFVVDMMRAFALAHPEIGFELNFDKKLNLKTDFYPTANANGDLNEKDFLTGQKNVLASIFRAEISEHLHEVNYNLGDLKITGFAGSTFITRSDRRGIFTFINKRLVKSYIMRSAIDAVYKELLSSNKHPIAVINIDLPINEVDINVHPAKLEVKFTRPNYIFESIGNAVSKTLADSRYEDSHDFQTKISDYELLIQSKQLELDKMDNAIENLKESLKEKPSHEETEEPKSFNDALVKEADKLVTHRLEGKKKAEKLSKSVVAEAAEEMVEGHFGIESDFGNERSETDDDSVLDSDKFKFLGRMGSVEMKLLNDTNAKTIISTQGNRTDFELIIKAFDFPQVLMLKGEFIGEKALFEKYSAFLNEFGKDIIEREIAKQAESRKSQKNKKSNRSRSAKKVPMALLEKVWRRDNYSCVYCGKLLLHPEKVKELSTKIHGDALIELKNHTATHDHHLPSSKYSELHDDERNLYACCMECNLKKSDSLASKTWTPKQVDNWKGKAQSIAGISVEKPE